MNWRQVAVVATNVLAYVALALLVVGLSALLYVVVFG